MWNLTYRFSKAFDCFPYFLMIGKLHVYGFDETSIEYLKDYMSHQKQKISKISTGKNFIFNEI